MSRPTKIFLLISFFIALRLTLFNFNAAEWGDSYHILRSARDITKLTYSLEEKRLPGLPALMAPFLFIFEPVTAGRIVAALATLAVLILSYKLSQKLFPKSNWHLWVPIFLCISPVFLYWSIRVMTIVPFTALVLLAFYIFERAGQGPAATGFRVQPTRDGLPASGGLNPFGGPLGSPMGSNPLKNFVEGWTPLGLGVVLGLACLTRYEGFLLLPGFFLFYVLKKRWRELFTVFIPWAVVTLPWFVWSKLIVKGPTGAAYFKEAMTFNLFDWGRFWFWGLSVLFLFVFPPFFAFVIKGFKGRLEVVKGDGIYCLPFGSFLVLEAALAFFWTPSVPRILIPVMPFLLMLFLEGVDGMSEPEFPRARLLGLSSGEGKSLALGPQSQALFLRTPWLIFFLALFLLYILGQYHQRAYFLVLSRGGMGLVLGFSGLALLSLMGGRWLRWKRGLRRLFYISLVVVLAVSSFVIVGNQRKIYATVREVSEQAAQFDGKTAYSDETGVSWWYLTRLNDKGVYFPQKTKLSSEEQWQWLRENTVKYVLWTNEFNRGSTLSILDDPEYEDRFEPILDEEVEVADVIDSFLIGAGVLPEREYPRLGSVLYEIVY